MKYTVSIIIPTLNSEKTIFYALKSIEEQTFKDIEVIIIDKCSVDSTLGIIQSFSSVFRNLIIVSEADTGIYDAMNKGIKLALGDWIYFLGSDDKLFDDKVLETIFTDSNLISNASIIYGNVLISGDAGWAKDGQIYDGEFTLNKLIEKNICHQSILFKRKIFTNSFFYNVDLTVCADWELNIRFWSLYRFHYTNNIIAVFMGGRTSTVQINNFSEEAKLLTFYKAFGFKLFQSRFSNYLSVFKRLREFEYFKSKPIKLLILNIIIFYHRFQNKFNSISNYR